MPDRDKIQRETMLEGYRELAGQLRHEESLSWKRLETFLVISSALVGLIGLFWPAEAVLRQPSVLLQPVGSRTLLTILISLLGLILSLAWVVVVRRSEAFHDFRYQQLIEMETSYLEPLSVFKTADDYFSRGSATVGGQVRHLDWISRKARIYQVMTVVPIVFAVVWAILLAFFTINGLVSLSGLFTVVPVPR